MSGYYNRNNRGITKKLGPVTAYADAVLAGYKGTREQWAQDMAKLGQNVTQVAQNTELTTELAEQTRENTEQVAKDTADVRRLADETSDNAVQVASNTAESNRLAKETKQAAAQAKADAEYAGAAADNFRVDTTLSEEGKAAEAKTVGEKFAQLSEEITDENNRAVKRENEIEELFTMPTLEAVSKWLDEHPEATTTVQDKSLTIDKMVVGALGYVTPEMFGAVGDGMTDDTEAIQAALNSAFCVVLAQNKTYCVQRTADAFALNVNSNTYVDGNNSCIKLLPTSEGNYQILNIRNATNVTVVNLRIHGDIKTHLGTDGETGEGLMIRDSQNVNILNCEIFECWGDSIRITGASTIKNVKVLGCHLHDSGRNGISIEDGENVLVDSCILHTGERTAPFCCFDVEPFKNTQSLKNIVISNCICENGQSWVNLSDVCNGCEVQLKNLTGHSVLILTNRGTNNIVDLNGGVFGRVILAQNDENSFYIIKNITSIISEQQPTFRNSNIFLDFEEVGKGVSGMYNVICEATIKSNKSHSPLYIYSFDIAKLTFRNCVFKVTLNGSSFAETSSLRGLPGGVLFKLNETVYVPTAGGGYNGMLNTFINDVNSVLSGNYALNDMIEGVEYTIKAGDANTSHVNVFVTGALGGCTLVNTGGLANANIPAGETRVYTRYGNKIYVKMP